jgi:hypothetical protein
MYRAINSPSGMETLGYYLVLNWNSQVETMSIIWVIEAEEIQSKLYHKMKTNSPAK